MDTINEDGYLKIPFSVVRSTPDIFLNVHIGKENTSYSIEGSFMVDYGYIGDIGLNINKLDNELFKQSRDTVSVQFNDITLNNIPLCMEPLVGEVIGVLGVRFLSLFDVIIDYKRKYLYIKPHLIR